MKSATPQHLTAPKCSGRPVGSLTWNTTRSCFRLQAEPQVLQLAKRVFLGASSGRATYVEFAATVRAVEDLNWLLLRFPVRIETDKLRGWRTKAIAHAAQRVALSALPPCVTPPNFNGALLPFQAEDVAKAVATQRTCVAWEVGLGKSVMSAACFAMSGALPALIVSPAPIVGQWKEVIEAFLPGESVHVIRGLRPYELPAHTIGLIHYGLLRGWERELPALGYRTVVFDEVQELRHLGTQKYSAASRVSGAAEHVYGLSATPIHNYGGEIWAVLNAIDEFCLGPQESFTREWCNGYLGRTVVDPEALGAYLRQEGLMLRRTASEVRLQLPPVRRVPHVIEKNNGVYATRIAEAVALASRYSKSRDFVERGRMAREIDSISRQATGVAKAPFVAAFVRGLLEAGERVLVFAHHHEVHGILREALKDYNPALHSGMQPEAQKTEGKERFDRGETPLAIIALRGAAGVDGWQSRGTTIVFAELDWSPAIHTQCEGRLKRIGVSVDLESILAYYLVCDAGSDETMREALGLKVSQFVGLMGEASESEEDKVLAGRAAERQMARVIDALSREAA